MAAGGRLAEDETSTTKGGTRQHTPTDTNALLSSPQAKLAEPWLEGQGRGWRLSLLSQVPPPGLFLLLRRWSPEVGFCSGL